MRLLILLVTLAAAPAQASELWCMPDKICTNDKCNKNTDTESSVRLHDPDGATPVMRAYVEDIAMAKIRDDDQVHWQGVTMLADTSITMTLALRKSDMTFTLSQFGAFGDMISTGLCEVQ